MSRFSARPLQALWASFVLLFLVFPNVFGDCTGKQSYVVTLSMSFTQNKDPSIPPPEDASVPILVGVSHTSDYFLFRNTRVVDDAAAEVARTRRSDKIAEKLDDLKKEGSVRSYFILEDVPIDDISQLEVTVEGEATRVSIMAPLTPSPAWFVGVDSYNVCKDNALVLEDRQIVVKTYKSGLETGESWTGKGVPVELKNALPVEELEDTERIAQLSVEQGTLGVNWWKILLGVLAGVAVLIILVIFIYPRCRRKQHADIPLTTQEEIDW